MINALRIARLALLAAAAASGLAACDQPVVPPTQPRPVATSPDARVTERRVRGVLAELVAYSNSPAGREALRPQQVAARARLDAVLGSPAGSGERVRLDELLARVRALSAAPQAPATGSR